MKTLFAFGLLAAMLSPAVAGANSCSEQVQAVKAEMATGHYDLQLRRKVNSQLEPLLKPRKDLGPINEDYCRKEVDAARSLLSGNPRQTSLQVAQR
ncbi:hypothetical protein [Chitinibacter sp. ZOR0017]|uniref:hypothetical protein n=1 Tax=Chitinibacter sp. ZOR0017 TaxID=1339254 RepID=UPI000645543C|nr:hypothetical protein [Chitinibacter sp. ZOR0017]